MYWPVTCVSKMNGPEPTMGSFLLVWAAFSSMFFQMCSGRIGTARRSMIGVGLLTVSTSVVASGAVAPVMFAT